MQKKRIIFFVQVQFNKRDYERFGIEILQSEGFKVEVWDFTPFLYPKIYAASLLENKFDYSGLSVFHSQNSAIKAIGKLGHEDVVVLFGLRNSFQRRRIFQHLSRKNIFYGISTQNSLPRPLGRNRTFFNKFSYRLLNLHKLPSYIWNKYPAARKKISPPNFVIAGGTYPVQDIKKSTHIIWAHTLDYDLFLESRKGSIENSKNSYVLFLDEYVPFHIDGLYENWKEIDPNDYYSKLESFFNYIEKKEKCKVIIAAHPRADYEKQPDYFNGREVIKGKTMELVKDSKYVLTHASTAINFAVFYHKPIVFFGFDLIKEICGHWIEVMAKTFGKKIISLDSHITDIEFDNAKSINDKYYNSYRESYIKKPGSPEKNTWRILADFIRTLH